MIAIIENNEVTYFVDFDRQPKEQETLTYPGCPESVEINEVCVKSINVKSLLPAHLLVSIEEILMELSE